MTITITGASGFIGRRLVQKLLGDGHVIHVLSRHVGTNVPSGVKSSVWDAMKGEPPAESLQTADAVIHLAGEPVSQRWTPEVKQRIRESRVRGTQHLVQALSTLSRRPSVLVSASAIGFYGSRGDEVLTESSAAGEDFLASVCVEWERQAELAESLGIRVVKIRTGVVLGRDGGALAKILPPFRWGAGGPLGSGKQWMSWIHLDDLVGLYSYALANPMKGAVNGTAPKPVTNTEFTKTLGSTLHRPAILPVPRFALKAMFGEMSEVLLSSQRVLPRAAEAAGYSFRYPELGLALQNLVE